MVEDVGFKKMMTKLCGALKDRSFNLSQEHYEKLSEKFSEEEMDEYDFMGAARAITKYANGRESDFCKDIIKYCINESQKNQHRKITKEGNFFSTDIHPSNVKTDRIFRKYT